MTTTVERFHIDTVSLGENGDLTVQLRRGGQRS
jgi:hypothetical protein